MDKKQPVKGSEIILLVKKSATVGKDVTDTLQKIVAQGNSGKITGEIVQLANSIGGQIAKIANKGVDAVERLKEMIGNIIPEHSQDGILQKLIDFIQGLKLQDEYITVGCQRSMTETRNADTIETTCKKSVMREYIQSYVNDTITCTGVWSYGDEAIDLLEKASENREPIYIQILRDDKPYKQGMATISSLEKTSDYNDVATYSITLQVSGLLERI
jgi:TP901-1 family phage major tail protein